MKMSFIDDKGLSVYSIALFVCLFASSLIFWFKSDSTIQDHLEWDELNYETLARKGLMYNALEKNSLNFVQFYKIGKARADKDTILNKELVKQYNYPDENENPFYLRHYHPPLATYFWSFFVDESNIGNNDNNLRISNIILGLISIIAFILAIRLSTNLSKNVMFYMLIVLNLFMFSPIFHYSFHRLNFHTVLFIVGIIFMAFLMKWIRQPNNKNALILGVSTALMFISLETALFIVSGALLGLILTKNIKVFFRSLIRIFIGFVLGMIVLWPGVVKTLAPIKTWIMYLARIFLKGNDEYSGVSIVDMWAAIYAENIVLISFLVVAFAVLLVNYRKSLLERDIIIPYAVALFYLVLISPFIMNKTYVFPALGLLAFAVIYHIAEIPKIKTNRSSVNKLLFPILTLMVLVSVVHNGYHLEYSESKKENIAQRIRFNEEMVELKEMLSDRTNIIAFNGQLLRYYLGRPDIIDMRKNQMSNPGFYIREDGLYKDVLPDLKENKIEAVIIHKEHFTYYPPEKTKILETYNYKIVNLKQFRVFLSQKNS
jgi:hypothetical protein